MGTLDPSLSGWTYLYRNLFRGLVLKHAPGVGSINSVTLLFWHI
jgi:hypothetical protein